MDSFFGLKNRQSSYQRSRPQLFCGRIHQNLFETAITVALQFHSHKSVQKLFHDVHIIFSIPLMDLKVISQFENEPLQGLASAQEVFS